MINFIFDVRKSLLKLLKVQWQLERNGRECLTKTGKLVPNFANTVVIFQLFPTPSNLFQLFKRLDNFAKKKQKEII